MDSADPNTVDRVEFLVRIHPRIVDANLPGSFQLPRLLHALSPPLGFRSGCYCNFGCAPMGSLLQQYRRHGARRSSHLLHSTTRIIPHLKSLDLSCSHPPLSGVLDFVCSFPLLEELSLFSVELEGRPTGGIISQLYRNSPDPHSLNGGNRDVTRKLLLPDCLRLSKIRVLSPIEYADLTNELVSLCSDTLEFLCVSFHHCVFSTAPVVDQGLIATL